MTDDNATKQEQPTEQFAPAHGVAAEIRVIFDALRVSGERFALAWAGVSLVAVIGATAYAQIRLNAWNQPFYDALARKDISGVGRELIVFAYIACALLILNVAQTWLSQMTRLKLREGLTQDLFVQWLSPRRCFLVTRLGEIGSNPDQRIHADAQRLAEVSTDLGVGLLQATLLLVSFVGVLWGLSAGVSFGIFGASVVIPGYMVWAALLYAAVASLASWAVGRPLVALGAERYARESELRFALMRINDHCEGIAVNRGEDAELQRLRGEFGRLLEILRQLVRSTTNLTWVTAGYGWFTIVAPIIVAAPAYFAGNLTFGALLMAVGAFTQVQQSLRWFVDNAGIIADWRATLYRVASFRQALLDIDRQAEGTGQISTVLTSENALAVENLNIASPAGVSTLSEPHLMVAPGEHVLIVGDPGSGKTLLFRTMAGLWGAGDGAIHLPREGSVAFVSKQPYIPEFSLRGVLAYPRSSDAFSDENYKAALARVGLDHLTSFLDRVTRWDKELTDSEQQALAFARLLLYRPRFVIVDEAISSLSSDARRAVFDVFENELADAALIYISDPKGQDKFFQRVLRLNVSPVHEGAKSHAGDVG
ncbi:MAG: ABC transporter ATP-binding protein/permease [Alphaproteobacteria bacterium]|nr:ABC transporter ATP-binding protein/permease [Alphaproteobacteria bacterium]MBM3653895.1 ABC transporter ATP-binding protein/permease [Alphaproteobacteria bacterium]